MTLGPRKSECVEENKDLIVILCMFLPGVLFGGAFLLAKFLCWVTQP